MKKINIRTAPFIHLLPLFLVTMIPRASAEERGGEFSRPTFDILRDTLFILDSVYLEVRLDRQTIYQHYRDGSVRKFSCSTGDRRLVNGIATREGIFQVSSKAIRTLSQQFGVYLNYWMGFDGGIGFHGLDGRSYYRFLGKRPSSHGCVRISNETGKSLIGSTPRGTVVIVHSGSPVRIIAFAGEQEAKNMSLIDGSEEDLLSRRMKAVLEGNYRDSALSARILLPRGTKSFRSIPVGPHRKPQIIQYPLEPIRMSLLTEENLRPRGIES